MNHVKESGKCACTGLESRGFSIAAYQVWGALLVLVNDATLVAGAVIG